MEVKNSNSGIDNWFQELQKDRTRNKALEVHKKLVDLLEPITGLEKRSFASKYLHFHFPDRFFLYDARAAESVRTLKKDIGEPRKDKQADGVDRLYADFFDRCELIRLKNKLTPREVDSVLLYLWSKRRDQSAALP